jgi:hypothetical protein
MSPYCEEHGAPILRTSEAPTAALSPRQRWGTCCPHDPECEHSFMEIDELIRWMNTPITDEYATEFEEGSDA